MIGPLRGPVYWIEPLRGNNNVGETMSVRNQYKAGAKGNYPTRHPAAPVAAVLELNPEPTTARGKRRSNNTPEYQANCKTRESQSYRT